MKISIIAAMLLACAGFAAAQTPANAGSNTGSGTSTVPQSNSTPNQKANSTKVYPSDSAKLDGKSVEGCLSSSGAGQFSVRSGNRDIAVVPSAAIASDFSSRVGQRVKVQGAWAQGEVITNTHSATQGNGSNLPQSDQPTTATPNTEATPNTTTTPNTGGAATSGNNSTATGVTSTGTNKAGNANASSSSPTSASGPNSASGNSTATDASAVSNTRHFQADSIDLVSTTCEAGR